MRKTIIYALIACGFPGAAQAQYYNPIPMPYGGQDYVRPDGMIDRAPQVIVVPPPSPAPQFNPNMVPVIPSPQLPTYTVPRYY